MADQLLFEQSNEPQGLSEPFISRQCVYVIDQNNGNYSGQIQLDTSSLSNSGKYASYSEAYLQVPLVLTMKGATNATIVGTPANATATVSVFDQDLPFAVGLKNGFHHLIHSVSVEYNNTNVIQLTPYTNFDVQYKLMTSLSTEDVSKFGSSIGFNPDSPDTFSYQSGALGANVRTGTGVLNNRDYDPGAYPTTGYTANVGAKPNQGFLSRQINCSQQYATRVVGVGPATTTTATTLGGFLSEDNAGVVADNFYRRNGTDHFWYVMATIRLKDMHDFFDKIPLVKGAYLRFIVNVNTCSHTLTFNKTGATTVNMSQESATIAANGSSPILVASGEANQGLAPLFTAMTLAIGASTTPAFNLGNVTTALPNGTYTAQVALDIGRSSIATSPISFAWGPQTRLYVPLYTMNPVQEEQYLSLNRTKKIVYNDIYQYQTPVGANGTFNALLTNGIPNPKTIVIQPFLQPDANYLNAAGTGVATAPYLSPFASEPGTTSPLVSLRGFNIQLAGVNMFVQNQDYDFEQFKNELSRQNAINGGLVDGLTSGLISEEEYKLMYRYYVCDVSRRLPAEDAVPKSVQILGQSLCPRPITLFTFIQFQREITIDLQTGQKLS